jgi:LEA14-like dessication related protein
MLKYVRISSVVLGVFGIGYSFYYFFKKQLELALNYEYKLYNFKITELSLSKASVKFLIQINNKSRFTIDVLEYDLNFEYKNVKVANAKSVKPFSVLPDGKFDIKALATFDFDSTSLVLSDLYNEAMAKKPIVLTINGFIDVKLFNFQKRIKFKGTEFVASENLLADLKLNNDIVKIGSWADDLLGNLGINS